MDSDQEGRNYFTPFFPNSVNLISASTNSGKTTLVLNFLKFKKNCFVDPNFKRAVVVLCNDKVNAETYLELANENFQVEVCSLLEFIPEQILNDNDVLIFEDVSELPPVLSESMNVLAHHYNLNSIFLITQSILKGEKFKQLLSLAHRVILFFSGVQASKVALHIKKHYFANLEIKDYFKEIISYCEKNKSVALFELNDVNGRFQTTYFAIVNFDIYFGSEKKQTFVFPKMNDSLIVDSSFSDNSTSLSDTDNLPQTGFVLVPVKNVIKKSVQKEKERKKETDKEKIWKKMDASLQEDIENGLKYKHQQFAKNIAKSILNSKYFKVSIDGKTLRIVDSPKSSVSLLDYLNAASRLGAPKETFEPVFYQITKLLILSKTPKFYIRNKNLFNPPSKSKKKNQKNQPFLQ